SQPDRFYNCMPMYHSSGFVLGFCASLVNANTFILGHRFSTKTFWQGNATVVQYVGETLRYLLAAPPQQEPKSTGKTLDRDHNVRMAFGNGLTPDVWEKFKQRFGVDTVAEFYAATDGAGGFGNYSSNSFASGAIGRSGAILGLLYRRS